MTDTTQPHPEPQEASSPLRYTCNSEVEFQASPSGEWVRAKAAQSQLTALRAERDEWHDRATEAQAERDAAREERDEAIRKEREDTDCFWRNEYNALVDRFSSLERERDEARELVDLIHADNGRLTTALDALKATPVVDIEVIMVLAEQMEALYADLVYDEDGNNNAAFEESSRKHVAARSALRAALEGAKP